MKRKPPLWLPDSQPAKKMQEINALAKMFTGCRYLLFFCSWALAQAVTAANFDAEQGLNELLVLSGIQSTVKQIEFAYSLNLDRQASAYQLNTERQQQLEQALERYQGENILALLKAELSSDLDKNSLAAALKILRAEVVETFRGFESTQGTAEQQQKLADYLLNNPLSEQRRALLRASHIADFGPEQSAILQSFAEVDTAVALDYLSQEWFSRNDPEGVKLWRRNIEKDYVKQYAQQGDAYLAFIYRFLRDEKLREYAELWNDQSVQWFMQTSLQALRQVLSAQRKPMLKSLEQGAKLKPETENGS